MARVCMLVTSELNRDPRVQKEAKMAHEAGHHVCVVCRSYAGPPMPYQVKQLAVRRKNNRLAKYAERLWTNVKLFLLALAGKPEIIHANDLDTLPAAYLVSKLSRARLVYDAHEMWSEMGDIGPMGKRVAIFIERFISKRADAVIAVSSYRARAMAKLLGIPEPHIVMNTPLYIKPDSLAPGDWVIPFRKESKRIVLYQGRYSKSMGLKEAVLSSEYLPENVILIFRGFGSIEDEIRVLITNRSLSDRVFLLPPVPMNAMVSSAVGAEIGLALYLPVNQNNLYAAPNKIFEYMMAGVPCVGSDLPYIREILCGLGVGEVFQPGNSEDMARVIRGILDAPERLDQMKIRCIEYAPQFSWEREGAKLLLIYESILT